MTTNEQIKPFRAHTDFANTQLLNMDIQAMRSSVATEEVADKLVRMITTSNFTDCLEGGQDHARAQKLVTTLRDMSCSLSGKVLFVQALARYHGVADQCRANFPEPSGDENMFNRNDWERNLRIVLHVIGQSHQDSRMRQAELMAELNTPQGPYGVH